jgi:hypothetical protein
MFIPKPGKGGAKGAAHLMVNSINLWFIQCYDQNMAMCFDFYAI